MISAEAIKECQRRAVKAAARYGPPTSSHEALGVIMEEVYELTACIRHNALDAIRAEALDVAAIALRLADACRDDPAFAARSVK